MKSTNVCHPCLEKLIRQTAELATPDPELRAKATEAGLAVLNRNFSYDRITTELASEAQRVIRRLTGNPDPYRQMKDKELKMGQLLFEEMRHYYGEDFRSCVKLSILGNTIDFFKNPDEVSQAMRKSIDFAIDDIDEVEKRLRKAEKVLFLADNAGECFFDLPLVKKIGENAPVIYVIKGSPVQNDITLEDLSIAGLTEEMEWLMTTGDDAVGLDLSSASDEFKEQFESADLVFAKGMGYYETLSELPVCGKFVYCLMAKCQPVANSLHVPLNSYVTLLQ